MNKNPDLTHDRSARSWIPVPEGSHFPVQNLPYGAFRIGASHRLGVRVGDHVVDLAAVDDAGLFTATGIPDGIFRAATLNRFLESGRAVWTGVRSRLFELLRQGARETGDQRVPDAALIPVADIEVVLPVEIGDYVDFYSSLEHATNLGKMFRPGGEALNPNWRYLPVGYHGRSGTVVVSGTDVRRPCGQILADDVPPPEVRPSRRLDFELEMGFVTGTVNALGQRVHAQNARDHILGMVLVNDWSARDIQRWEYVPLGPFLGKSFATSMSPWIVTLDALEPFRVDGPKQDPPAAAYLKTNGSWAYDIDLEVEIVPPGARVGTVSTRTNFRHMYWNIAQQFAHAGSNGATIRAGDLFASGTISGAERGSFGSLVETTWGGRDPLEMSDGTTRSFLEDGDTVIMRGRCGTGGGLGVGFGEVRGTVLPAEE